MFTELPSTRVGLSDFRSCLTFRGKQRCPEGTKQVHLALETVSWSGGCGADGRATGQGVAESTWDDKVERAEGDYVGGRLNGRGVLTMPDGGRYEGEVRDGKPDGRGVLTMANGASRYEGEFRDGKPNGFSTYSWPSGKLTGTWTNGCGRDGLRTAWVGTTREQCGF